MKKIRIVHIAECLESGVGIYVVDVANRQIETADVTIIGGYKRADKRVLDSLKPSISLVQFDISREISPLSDLLSAYYIAKTLRQLKPDVIHLHSSKAGFLGRFICFLIGLRSVCFYTPHGLSFLRTDISWLKKMFFIILEKIGSLLAPSVIACSKSESEIYRRFCPYSNVFLCENSVKIEKINQAKNYSSPLRIINVARVTNQKNPTDFIKIAQILSDHDINFTWIGDCDPEFIHLFTNKNVRYISSMTRKSVLEYLCNSDLFLTTSLWEGLPLSLIEAVSLGLPVVSFDISGCNDIVVQGVNGFLCRDVNQMVDCILKIDADRSLLQQMSVNASDDAASRFSFDGMMTTLDGIYRSCLEKSDRI